MDGTSCNAHVSRCVCILPAEQTHDVHECGCGGAWEMREGRIVPWVMPGGPDGTAHKLALIQGWKPGI